MASDKNIMRYREGIKARRVVRCQVEVHTSALRSQRLPRAGKRQADFNINDSSNTFLPTSFENTCLNNARACEVDRGGKKWVRVRVTVRVRVSVGMKDRYGFCAWISWGSR